MSAEIQIVGAAANAPEQVTALANRLARAQQCQVRIAHEASGYHIYLPCPDCVDPSAKGRRELQDPKYAINASKYLGLGDAFRHLNAPTTSNPSSHYLAEQQSKQRRHSGICMRTRDAARPHRYTVEELLSMPSIGTRHPDLLTRAQVIGQAGSADRESHWETDPKSGKLAPPPPGEVIPLIDLPDNHPVIEYVRERGFDPVRLHQQFGCGFCTKEYPHGQNGIYYRHFPGGWRDTAQHRLIFYAMIDGVPLTWQGRYPERISQCGCYREMLHPYELRWDLTHSRPSAAHPWMPVAPFDELDGEGDLRFSPSKYRTAKHSSRELMGWDAAVERGTDWCVLCEGPLDAARVGPGGLALIGKSISPANLEKIVRTFETVYTAFDNDKAGKEATEKITNQLLASNVRRQVFHTSAPITIPHGKDVGGLTQAEFDEAFQMAKRRASRGR